MKIQVSTKLTNKGPHNLLIGTLCTMFRGLQLRRSSKKLTCWVPDIFFEQNVQEMVLTEKENCSYSILVGPRVDIWVWMGAGWSARGPWGARCPHYQEQLVNDEHFEIL